MTTEPSISGFTRQKSQFSLLGHSSRTGPLAAYVAKHVTETASLIPRVRDGHATRDEQWKLRINAAVERDL